MIDTLREAYKFLFDVQGLLQWGGTLLVCVIVFVETGLFLGFLLPGDSLLVTAGIFAAAGHLRIASLLTVVALCAVAGDQVGYVIGKKAGQALYRRKDTFLFRRRHLERAHEFYEKYGSKTIVLARFVPIIRTFAPAVAGAARMNYRRFVTYNVFGGVLWVWSMVLIGFSLGTAVPDIDRHIHAVIAVIVVLSILPAIFEAIKQRSRRPPELDSGAQSEPADF
jgi:membrane-associated protein